MKRILILTTLLILFLSAWAGASDLTDWLEDTTGGKTDYTTLQLYKDGYIDVQWFNNYDPGTGALTVDATGTNDSRMGIYYCAKLTHEHITDGQSPQYTVLFSHQDDGSRGIYLISDVVPFKSFDSSNSIWGYTRSHHVVGANNCTVANTKPLIKITDGATAFDSGAVPMFWFWRQKETGDTDRITQHDFDRSFDHTVRWLEFDTNEKAGATALEFYGAQGSTVEDVDIVATNSLAGFSNVTSYGVMHTNVSITGGQYAISNQMCTDTDYTVCEDGDADYHFHQDFVGCTFTDQEDAIINFGTRQNQYFMLVGCHISNSGTCGLNNGTTGVDGGILLDRCLVEMGSSTTLLQDSWNDMAVIHDTYTTGVNYIISGGTELTTTNYTHIQLYADPGTSTDYYNKNGNEAQNQTIDESISGTYTYTQAELIASLITPTKWTTSFPDYWDADVYNPVESTDHGDAVDNTGATDCTSDLQDALDYCDTNSKVCFLPRGIYSVTDTIDHPANVEVIGMGRNATSILASTSWTPTSETTIWQTVSDANGTGILAYLSVRNQRATSSINPTHRQFNPIDWRVGRNSIMRGVLAGVHEDTWVPEGDHRYWRSRFKVSGNGGGRWWNSFARGRTNAGSGREGVYVDATDQPLIIYGFNHVMPYDTTTIYINNSDDVVIYNNDQEGTSVTTVYATESDNLKFFGQRFNGTGDTDSGQGAYELNECDNVLIAGVLMTGSDTYNTVYEYYGSTARILGTSADDVCAFRRGTFPFVNVEAETPTGENDFTQDSDCFALYNFESGALTTDSKGGNTLVAGDAPAEDTTNYKQGACSADFINANTDFYLVTDANLDANFPLKNGDSQKIFSFAAWIKPDSSGDLDVIIAKWIGATDKRSAYMALNTSDQLSLGLGFNAGTEGEVIDHGSTLTRDQSTWYYVAVSYQDSDKAYALRVRDTDGSVVGSDVTGTATLDENKLNVEDANLSIACFNSEGTPANYFDGNIDELISFDKFLTADNVTDIASGEYSSPQLTFSSLASVTGNLTSAGTMKWVSGANRKPTVDTSGGVPSIGITFDYPVAEQQIYFNSIWNETTGWTNTTGTIYKKTCEIETTSVWKNQTTLLTEDDGDYAGLSDGEWDYYDGELYVNVGSDPSNDEIRITPWPVYFAISTLAGWRQDAWADANIGDNIALNSGTITDEQDIAANVTGVFSGLGTYPANTVANPFLSIAPYAFTDTNDYTAWLAAGNYTVINDNFVWTEDANTDGFDASGEDGTSLNEIIYNGQGFTIIGSQTFGDYSIIQRFIHGSTIILGTGDNHEMNIIPNGSTLQVTGTSCIITNDTIKGTLNLDSDTLVRNTAIPGTVSLANGKTLTANYCRFEQTEAEIETNGGTVIGGNNTFNVSDFGFTDEEGGKFSLTNESLLKNTGHDYDQDYDVTGVSIPQGLGPDIGAHEYSYESHFYGDHETLYSDTSTTDLNPFELPDDYDLVYEDDDNFIAVSAKENEYAIYLWRNKNENHSDQITATWKGRTNVPASQQSVCMQIYNVTTGLWETLICNETAAAATKFTLTKTVEVSVEDYYDTGDWVTFRIYQHW